MKVLEAHTFENVKAMLESPDQENVVVGFQCLKEATLCKENLVYILWMISETNIELSKWKTEVPSITTLLDEVLGGDPMYHYSSISAPEILRIMKSYGDLPANNYGVFADRYAKYLEKSFSDALVALSSGPPKFKVELKITKL